MYFIKEISKDTRDIRTCFQAFDTHKALINHVLYND